MLIQNGLMFCNEDELNTLIVIITAVSCIPGLLTPLSGATGVQFGIVISLIFSVTWSDIQYFILRH